MPIPVAVGNTTNAEAAFALMEQGAAAVFVGVGPGAACTTREVLGIGVPQVTAISDVAAARDAFLAETGRYVPVVADGGMRRGGELAKAIAAGADVLMIGSPLARAEEAPGRGTNWGMAAPSPTLPRGTRIKVGTVGSLERILLGPAHVTDGSENLVGALRQSMAALGARTIRDMQRVEMVYAPSTQTEGKSWQREPLTIAGAPRGRRASPRRSWSSRPRRGLLDAPTAGAGWTFGPTLSSAPSAPRRPRPPRRRRQPAPPRARRRHRRPPRRPRRRRRRPRRRAPPSRPDRRSRPDRPSRPARPRRRRPEAGVLTTHARAAMEDDLVASGRFVRIETRGEQQRSRPGP